MAATILSGESDWAVSSRVFRVLLDAAKSADICPTSRFLQLIDQFEAVQVINLDELDHVTRADVLDALRKGTTTVLMRVQSEAGELIPSISADSLLAVFKELDQMLNDEVGNNP